MSNIGLKAILKEKGINHIIADVGDRYVAEEMRSSGSILGGEDSGHMIFMDKHTTGDGIYSALKILEIMCKSTESLSKLSGIMKVFPQKLINIKVNSKPDIYSIPEIKSCIEDVESRLKGLGRVLVRYSGTQLLCRVMVEGPTTEETETCCQEIAELIRLKIGV
jgi:phosphoglucosamine mutase